MTFLNSLLDDPLSFANSTERLAKISVNQRIVLAFADFDVTLEPRQR